MDIFWEDSEIRQQVLNRLGDSTGECYQYYSFREQTFYFSDNIKKITNLISCHKCSVHEWYNIIYDNDRIRLKRHVDTLFKMEHENYYFNYRIYVNSEQLAWVSSKGKCYFNEKGEAIFFLGNLFLQKNQKIHEEHTEQSSLLKELEQMHRQGRDGYLLLVDVDDLRRVNLKYGHEFGNGVLEELRTIMSNTGPRPLFPFRVNSSSFCVLFPGAEKAEVEAYFHTVLKKLEGQCTISGGCVSWQEYQVPRSEVLLQYAESSLESAKMTGKSQLSFFQPEDYERKLAAMELLEDVEAAVKDDFRGFFLVYQAQVRSETFELSGAEALLRFESPRRGMVSPAECIPVLEQSELIVPVGLWIIRNALNQCRIWRTVIPDFRVSVNMSYVQLSQPGIQADVLRIVRESGVPGSALTIEVTEGMELRNYPYLNTVFSTWKKEGIEISVDDFGTGYSSLSWLKELAIDEIKIDRCFVRDIQHSAYNLRLLSNIIELADSGQVRVCCEGVETEDELAVLEQLHPDLYQGYFFSKPVPPGQFDVRKSYLSLTGNEHPAWKLPRLLPEVETQEACFDFERMILATTEDILSLCDVQTYEMYYLNPAGRRLFGVGDYRGRKCYDVLRGRDAPCEICPNAILRHDSFHTWEDWNSYCNRHFLLKSKLLDMGGRTLRLGVGMDITRREYVSRKTQERLDFARRITGYVDVLHRQQDWERAANLVLASAGEFYKADRAYLFELSPKKAGYWDNTFEWCAPGITPQKEYLQQVSPEAMARWMDLFMSQGSIAIYNKEPLRNIAPLEWEMMTSQNIQRLIAVPLMEEGRVIGFIGVDNPRYAIEDDTQVRVLASFLVVRFQRERNNREKNIPS